MGLKKVINKVGSGQSHSLVIDRAIMELLGWQAGTVLDITTDGVCLVLRADGVDASGGAVGLRSRATIKRKTKEIRDADDGQRQEAPPPTGGDAGGSA